MRIIIVGAGYVGLVSGVCLAEVGHEVICVDRDVARIAALRKGISPIYEPGLEEMVVRNMRAGHLSFETELAAALAAGADAAFICVGTPEDPVTGHANLSAVWAVAEEIAIHGQDGLIVVTKSTVPVGTNRRVAEIMHQVSGRTFAVVSNPEFLREGSAIGDFMYPDRIVIGAECEAAFAVMAKIYEPFTSAGFEMVETDIESAEMIKYASNAFLATKVTFINEIARLCEKTGADVTKVSRGMGLDPRIGARFLEAGPGYGGSCFPKDTSALASVGRDVGVRMNITEAVIAANVQRKQEMVEKIVDLCDGSVAGKTLAIFGVTFKPNTDDIRDAPSLAILPQLHALGASIRIVDPQGSKEGVHHFPWASWHDAPLAAASGADAVVIITEWDLFKGMDLAAVAQGMAMPRLADLRNIFAADTVRAAGFVRYAAVGRTGY